MQREGMVDRRDFIRYVGAGALGLLGASVLGTLGCEPVEIAPTDERGRLYWDRRKDIEDTLKRLDTGQAAVNDAILRAANKFDRATHQIILSLRILIQQ